MNIAVFASGSGTNAENIAKYFSESSEINVTHIISNKPNAYVLERAKKFNIKTSVFNRSEFATKVPDIMVAENIDYIILAGFLLLIPKELIQKFPKKIINIHPALLPKFGGKGMYGMNVHKAVKEAQETETGITVHYVNEFFDEGEIISQHKCQLSENDSPDDIAAKIHTLEQTHFPKVIEQVFMEE